MRVIVGVGAPSHTYEAAVSTTLRAWEVLGEKPTAIYSPFARGAAERLKNELGIEIVEAPQDFGELLRLLRDMVDGETAVFPTSASLAVAIAMTRVASEKDAYIGHVYFPFGPWTGLHYPYVPRFVQRILFVERQPPGLRKEVDPEAVRSLPEKPSGLPELRAEVAAVSYKFNVEVGGPYLYNDRGPRVCLKCEPGRGLSLYVDGVKVDGVGAPRPGGGPDRTLKQYEHCVGDGPGSNLYDLLACAFSCRNDQLASMLGYTVPRLEQGRKYVVDTSALYRGIHNVAGEHDLLVPYCVHVEVLHALAEGVRDKPEWCGAVLARLLWLAYEVVRAHSGHVPTHPYKCDVVLPTADPELLRDTILLTDDRRAAEAWKKTALRRYADIETIGDKMQAAGGPTHIYAVFQTLAAAKLIGGQAVHP